MITALLPQISAAVIGILCVTAGFLDVRDRRLPNWLCAMTAAFGLIAVAVLLSPYAALLAAAHGLAALIVGMVLFQFGVFGGGDAKFYAGIACWFPISKGILLIAATSFYAILFVFFWFVVSFRKRKDDAPSDAKKAMLPFGVPIAAAGMTVFWLNYLSG